MSAAESSPSASAAPPVRSVQSCLDETPVRRDGTGVLVTPMTRMQWRIWWLAVSGMGLALGCDCPTAHLAISESTDTRRRARLVLGAFASLLSAWITWRFRIETTGVSLEDVK